MDVHPHKDTDFFIQLDVHDGIFIQIPPIPIPGKAIHLAGGQLKWASRDKGESKDNQGLVLADGDRLISVSHEVTSKIPHLPIIPLGPFIPLLNVLLPLIIYGSSSKNIFSCGSVEAPEGVLAAASLNVVGLNLACFDPVSVPSSFVITGGTVTVGITCKDVLSCDPICG